MKAVLVNKPFEVEIREVPTPVIEQGDDMIVKVLSGGICGSDIGIFTGSNALATYPRIIGHEFAGYISEIGADITDYAIGDLVAIDPVNSCGTCYACRTGHHNVCSTVAVTGVHVDGGFTEYVKVKPKNAYKIDAHKIDPLNAALVEPYSIGVEANELGTVQKGDKVLVLGSGPIGITIMQVAKTRGAEVMMTDILDKRLERAKQMGADKVINVLDADLKEEVAAFTNGEGAYVVIDAVCSDQSILDALDTVAPSGRVVALGTGAKTSAIPQLAFTKKGVTVVGSRLNNYRFNDVISLFENGEVTPSGIKTHAFHFTQIAEAFQFIKDNQNDVCKVVITFDK